MFISPSVSVSPASSASMTSTALHECRSITLLCPLYNCIDVLVKEVQSLLAVLRVLVVTGSEVILQINFQISMLRTALPQKSAGKVAFFVVLGCD